MGHSSSAVPSQSLSKRCEYHGGLLTSVSHLLDAQGGRCGSHGGQVAVVALLFYGLDPWDSGQPPEWFSHAGEKFDLYPML